MKLLLTLPLLLLSLTLSAQTLPGRITLQNSGRKPVQGALVKASLANSAQTATDGSFSLSFAGKAPGYDVVLEVEKEGLEVVNKKDLFTTLKADPSEALSLYMCPKGQWEQAAMAYYNINEQHILRRYREEVERIKQRYAQQEALMQDSLRILGEQFTALNEQARELAETFAIANLDDATDLYVSAFRRFEQGDVQGALQLLDPDALSADLSRIRREQAQGQQLIAIGQGRLVAAQEAIHQGIENYKLKARLCVLDYRFDEAERSFQKAVDADTTDFDNVFEFANFLREQNRFMLSVKQYKRALELAASLTHQADVLHNLGIVWSVQNDYLQALVVLEEALKIYQSLAEADPSAHLPYVATTLHNLVSIWTAQNDYARGVSVYEEALNIYRRLANNNPELYLAYVARAQNSLGKALADKNDYARAMISYEEALEIHYKLAATNSEIHLSYVAMTLNNLGGVLMAQNNYARSVHVYEEALNIYRRLAKNNPEANLHYVARVQIGLANSWRSQNDYVRAMPAYEEALAIYRKLAETSPEAYLPNVAVALNNLGAALADQNDYTQAVPAHEEALKIYRKLAENSPEAYLSHIASALNNLGVAWTEQKDYAQAVPASKEALKIYRKLAETNPEVYLPDVAMTLNTLGAAWTGQNDYAQAMPAYEEALKVYRKLAETNPEVYLPEVAGTLHNLGVAWADQKDYRQAIPAYEAALKVRRQHAAANPEVYLPYVAQTMNALGTACLQQGMQAESYTYLQEAASIWSSLARQHVAVYGVETASSLSVLGSIHHLKGQISSRDSCWQAAQQWLDISPETARSTQIQQMLDQLKQIAAQHTEQEEDPLTKALRAIQEMPTYAEKMTLQQVLNFALEPLYKNDPGNTGLLSLLSQQYGNLSWYALFVKDYALAESSAKKALELDNTQLYVYTNLGHSYLMRGRYQEAQEAYKPLLGKKDDSGKPYEQIILEDLAVLEKEGVTHPDVQKIKKWLMP
ncbi:MAG: tetratricopeptide repeat protein [Bacteroidia bacterium]|nr:tetratricopeptide repeat protein [Bacteroidia bacterium]